MKQQARAIVLNESSHAVVQSTYPKFVQSIQLTKLAKALKLELLPIIIELDKDDETGFTRDWQPYYGSDKKDSQCAKRSWR
jgi:hypothetical protein